MRTTVTVDDHLLRQAKDEAVRTGHTLGYVVEEALRERFARQMRAANGPRIVLPTFRPPDDKWGVMPGVDLDNNAALLDLMDECDASH